MIIARPKTIRHFKELLTQPHQHLNAILVGSTTRTSEKLVVFNTCLSCWVDYHSSSFVRFLVWGEKLQPVDTAEEVRAQQTRLLEDNQLGFTNAATWFQLLSEEDPEMYQFLLFNLDLFLLNQK